MCQSVFFNKVAAWPATLLKKETLAQVFSCEFSEISKNTSSYKPLRWLFWHFQTWFYEIEQNRNYSTNLTTIKYDLDQ